MKVFLILALFLVIVALSHTVSATTPVDHVNILGGTDSRYDLSHGSTLPLIGLPWAFNTYAPQTDDDPTWPGWWFHPTDRRFYGMRVTHQPSPWISDYGNFLIKASIPAANNYNDPNQFSGYDPTKSTFTPYYFRTSLMAYGTMDDTMDIDFAPTNHGAIMLAKFPKYVNTESDKGFEQTRRISIVLHGGSDSAEITTDENGVTRITGFTKFNHGGVSNNFAHYFAIEIYTGANGDKAPGKPLKTHADSTWAYVDFAAENPEHTLFTVRVGTSLISVDQAITSLKAEVGTDKTFRSVVESSKDAWNKVLGKIQLTDVGKGYNLKETKDMQTTFYSTMYRASLFPRVLSEVNSNGEEVHWSPYDGQIHYGSSVTDSGFWDAYSTVYPLHTIVNQKQLGTMLQGWLNAYKEGGWLPKWASPGYRFSMVGTMGDVSLADAIVKNIPNFDQSLAYEAIRKDAFEEPPHGVDGIGRVCLSSYLKYGYIPRGAPMTTGGECYEVVSRTLNYLQSDFAIAQAATKLGKNRDAQILMSRANNFSATFDGSTGFFRSRSIVNQKFTEPFDQFAWGGDYTEAGPWQYKFYVPYDAMGLAKLYEANGRDMCEELQKTQTMPSTFHVGGFSSEIHEQTEMPANCWGQYEHNNQPVHHMLYMFGAIDKEGYSGSCAAKGQYWLRQAMTKLYKPGTDMFVGDEDNGQMSAWYLLSSMGLYSLNPGTTDYVFGSPLFGRLDISLDNGKTLSIVANENSAENVYVQSISWNGEVLKGTNSIAYSKLMEGGVLQFEMGPNPVSVESK